MNFRVSGWSLLELAMTISIMVILAGISLPSYRHFILQSNRRHAESYLLSLSIRLEDYFLENHRYSGADLRADQDAPSGYFFDSILGKKHYQLVAIPTGSQAEDDCGRLGLASDGEKTAVKSGCWQFN